MTTAEMMRVEEDVAVEVATLEGGEGEVEEEEAVEAEEAGMLVRLEATAGNGPLTKAAMVLVREEATMPTLPSAEEMTSGLEVRGAAEGTRAIADKEMVFGKVRLDDCSFLCLFFHHCLPICFGSVHIFFSMLTCCLHVALCCRGIPPPSRL